MKKEIKTKEDRIKEELKALTKVLADIPDSKKKVASGLIDNAAFMRATLEELRQKVDEDGAVIEATNGNGFEVCRENPALTAYSKILTGYNKTISQLIALLPDSKTAEATRAGDALGLFVSKGKPVELR